MAAELTTRTRTAEQFLAEDLGEGTFELVRGEVVRMSPSSPEHGLICANLAGIHWEYGRRSGFGYCLSNDSSVLTERNPDTVRGPDVAFYSRARWPREQVGRTLPPVAPDLVVEVSSPGNRPGAMHEKIGEYLNAGALMVWVVYPKSRTLAIYRSFDVPPVVLDEGGTLEDLPVLPGFRCPVSDVFR
jgi:Uma2 family endonuclease